MTGRTRRETDMSTFWSKLWTVLTRNCSITGYKCRSKYKKRIDEMGKAWDTLKRGPPSDTIVLQATKDFAKQAASLAVLVTHSDKKPNKKITKRGVIRSYTVADFEFVKEARQRILSTDFDFETFRHVVLRTTQRTAIDRFLGDERPRSPTIDVNQAAIGSVIVPGSSSNISPMESMDTAGDMTTDDATLVRAVVRGGGHVVNQVQTPSGLQVSMRERDETNDNPRSSKRVAVADSRLENELRMQSRTTSKRNETLKREINMLKNIEKDLREQLKGANEEGLRRVGELTAQLSQTDAAAREESEKLGKNVLDKEIKIGQKTVEIEDLQKRLGEQQGERTALENDVKKALDEKTALEAEKVALETNLKKQTERAEAYKQQHVGLRGAYDKLKNEKEKSERTVGILEGVIANGRQQLQKLTAEKTALEAVLAEKARNGETKNAAFAEEIGKVKTLEAAIERAQKELREANKAKTTAESQAKELEKRFEGILKETVAKVRGEKNAAIDRLKALLTESLSARASLETELTKTRAKLEELQAYVTNGERLYEELLRNYRELEPFKQQVETLQAQNAELQRRLDAVHAGVVEDVTMVDARMNEIVTVNRRQQNLPGARAMNEAFVAQMSRTRAEREAYMRRAREEETRIWKEKSRIEAEMTKARQVLAEQEKETMLTLMRAREETKRAETVLRRTSAWKKRLPTEGRRRGTTSSSSAGGVATVAVMGGGLAMLASLVTSMFRA